MENKTINKYWNVQTPIGGYLVGYYTKKKKKPQHTLDRLLLRLLRRNGLLHTSLFFV